MPSPRETEAQALIVEFCQRSCLRLTRHAASSNSQDKQRNEQRRNPAMPCDRRFKHEAFPLLS